MPRRVDPSRLSFEKPSGGRPLLPALLLAAALIVIVLPVNCGFESGSWARDKKNLLAGLAPRTEAGPAGLERLTDGDTAQEGDRWDSAAAVTVSSDAVVIEIDLVTARSIRAVALQADNNDYYTIETAAAPDGAFTPLWTAAPVEGAGLRTRWADGLSGEGRLLRIRAGGGDSAYSITEVAVYGETPSPWPPAVPPTPLETARRWLIVWAAIMIVWIFLNRKSGRPWRLLAALPAALTVIGSVLAVARAWPLAGNDEAFIRAVIAAAAGVLLVWDAFAPERRAPDPRFTAGVLAALCLAGALSFYHFGAPQFRHQSEGRGTYVHPWDLRNYYPVAKYFPELRYDGVYAASVAAFLDNHPELDAASALGPVRMRDLSDNRMVYASEILPKVEAVRARFSPERWRQFCRDMAGFEAMMGAADYLGSLQDHGGNATPVWVTTAHLLWRWAPSSEIVLLLTGLLDPLLLILLFIVIGRTYGLRAMLIALLIFGTTDFSRFGTNLAGSTLRFDWIALLGLGACALKAKHWALGGVLVVWAGLIRGFPAVAALFLIVPAGYWLFRKIRTERRLPGLSVLMREQTPLLRAAAGGLVCLAFWIVVPVALFSWQSSWGAWLNKIAIHMDKPNVNHVGLVTLTGYDPALTAEKVIRWDLPEPWTDWQNSQLRTRAARAPLFLAGALFFTALAVLAARRARLDQAVLLGMFLVPVFFYPANYYLHYILLLPLAAAAGAGDDRRPAAFMAAVICAATVAQYFTLFTPWSDVCYTWQSVILLSAWLLMLGGQAWLAWDRPGLALAREWWSRIRGRRQGRK